MQMDLGCIPQEVGQSYIYFNFWSVVKAFNSPRHKLDFLFLRGWVTFAYLRLHLGGFAYNKDRFFFPFDFYEEDSIKTLLASGLLFTDLKKLVCTKVVLKVSDKTSASYLLAYNDYVL